MLYRRRLRRWTHVQRNSDAVPSHKSHRCRHKHSPYRSVELWKTAHLRGNFRIFFFHDNCKFTVIAMFEYHACYCKFWKFFVVSLSPDSTPSWSNEETLICSSRTTWKTRFKRQIWFSSPWTRPRRRLEWAKWVCGNRNTGHHYIIDLKYRILLLHTCETIRTIFIPVCI